MGEIKTFRDLIVWQKAHEMALRVIVLVTLFPRAQLFWVIGDQLLRSSTSIGFSVSLKPVSYKLLLPRSLKPIA